MGPLAACLFCYCYCVVVVSFRCFSLPYGGVAHITTPATVAVCQRGPSCTWRGLASPCPTCGPTAVVCGRIDDVEVHAFVMEEHPHADGILSSSTP